MSKPYRIALLRALLRAKVITMEEFHVLLQ